MKLLKNKILYNFLFLFLPIISIEFLFRTINNLAINNIAFFRIFLEVIVICSLLSLIFSLFSKKVSKYLNLVVVLIFSAYAFIELLFNNFLGVYMSFNTTSQAGAVKNYILDFLKSMKPVYLIVFIPFLIMILGLIFIKVHNKGEVLDFKLKKVYNYEYQIISLIMLIMVTISSLTFYHTLDDKYIDEYQVTSLKSLFKNASNPSLCIKDFGIISYGLIDLKTKTFGVSDEEFTFAYDNSSINNNSTRKFDDSAWQNVINNETNTTLNTLNNYYITKDIPDKNEYTGLFKDKNLIVIMMESVNDVILNEEYFPNFAYLLNHSYYFENNYSPRNSCATGNNEFSAMTSLYSIYNSCTSNIYVDNTYFESIFNLFNNAGYTTNSYHDFNDTYYARTKIHPNMGSMNYYDANTLNMDYETRYGVWASDEELMTDYLENLDNETSSGPFMSYITTVSTHQPYVSSSKYGDMYLDLYSDTNYSIELKRYLSKMKVLDNSLGILIEGLKERNILDDTVIVLFGDHYPYGIPLNILNEILDRDLTNYENEKVPLVIFSSDIEEKQTSNLYTSYINLVPTIANLFDLDYDPRLYEGEDLFSESYNDLVAFYDMSWKNNLAYFNASTGKITYYTDFKYTDEEIKEINEKIYLKMNTSSIAIKNNYFAYLNNALAKERENIN